jgi:hypothetical protein
VSPVLEFACGVIVASMVAPDFFPAWRLQRRWGCVAVFRSCVLQVWGTTKRKLSPTLLSVAMVTAFLNVVLPVGGTIVDLPASQHLALSVKTLPSLGERRRCH